MAVNFTNLYPVQVLRGVELGTDADINDEAQRFYHNIAEAMALELLINTWGDVLISAEDKSTAAMIPSAIKIKIEFAFAHRLYLARHSLSSVYALQVIAELMQGDSYLYCDDTSDWPVQGLVTLGCPLGLDLTFVGIKIFDDQTIMTIQALGYLLLQRFIWHNYFNPFKPIVSGHIFGSPVNTYGSLAPVEKRNLDKCHQGKPWFFAHTSYWNSSVLGDPLISQLWG
jgi:hypothetical protein